MTTPTPISRAIARGFPPLHCNKLAEPGFTWRPEQATAIRKSQHAIDFGGIAIIKGEYGNGKTQIAARFGCQSIKELQKPMPRYWVCAELLDAQRNWYSDSKGDSPIMAASTCGLLVLDDLRIPSGKTDHDYEQLGELMDIRYRNRRPTLIMTNLDASGLRASLGDKTIDRVRDGGALIELRGKSLRGGAA